MIEVLKTSDGKAVCEQKLLKCIRENQRCILIVDSDNLDLAVYLKNKHILMNTFVKNCFLKESSFLYAYPNIKILEDNEVVHESDVSDINFFLGISDFDIDNPDDYTKTLFELQRQVYYKESFVETQYALILKNKKTFSVSKNLSSNNLIENGILNLFPTDFYKGRSDYAIVTSNSISVITHTYGDRLKTVIDDFFSELQKFLLTKNPDIVCKNNDLFINDKKFFSGGINYRDYRSIVTNTGIFSFVLYFKPEQHYFKNIMKYNGKNEYTGFLEETPLVNYIDILNQIILIFIKLLNEDNCEK